MKKLLGLLLTIVMFLCAGTAQAGLTDIKFGQSQIADSQWNVNACLNTTTCQIYSKNPGTMYQIPWWNGQWAWQAGQYVKFALTGDSTNPYEGKVYNSNGTQAGTIGTGHIVNMGPNYFFFVGNDNDTGQLFSGSSGMNNTSGVSWTGTLNPTLAQADSYATANYSTTPLAAGQTAVVAPPAPAGPVIKPIYVGSANLSVTGITPTSYNSPGNEGAANAFDNNPNTKYLNFDKNNAGVTIKLNQGRVVSGFKITTANDFPGRDPTSYKLYGSNDGVHWTLIKADTLALTDNRYTQSSLIDIGNTSAYFYYFIYFPTTKAGQGCGLNCNSMQIGDITYFYDENNLTASTDQTGNGGTISNPGTAGASVDGENSLCCGGSAAAFNANAGFASRVNNFASGGFGAIVLIEQIGSSNSTTITQSGTDKNYIKYYANGNNNSLTSSQTSTSSTATNYVEFSVTGSNNTTNITQQSTGGAKGVLATVANGNNNVTFQQKDNGNHYLELNLSGSDKTVNVLQQGSAAHMANINLSGGATSITTTQSGATQQFYSITHNCATSSCAAITVTQGQ